MPSLLEALLLILVGAIASGINAVAGGGSLVSFPYLSLGMGIPAKMANATNAVGIWPGSLSGAVGFRDLYHKTGHHLRSLALPTLLGSVAGALLLITTRQRAFEIVVPFLLLLASLLLAFQPRIKKWALGHRHAISGRAGIALQFVVSVYGGYFGAGMGIMMLACFALYMEGSIHELNAIKAWLGLIINFVASLVFVTQGLVAIWPAIFLALGSIIGGFWAAKLSVRVDSELLRKLIAIYGFAATVYFAWATWG
ncbi:MAG: sulfite exporter TauE/SafE family protein [Fimbriimonadaceae bacterium]|mgnify:CR=1 FL=1